MNWRPACSRWRSNPTGVPQAGPRCTTPLSSSVPASAERSRAAHPGGEGARQAAADALRGHGFEPSQDEDGIIRLRNCPFHQLAAEHRDLVCGMNLALIEGLVAGLGANGLQPVLDPQPGHCCVVIGSGAPSDDVQGAETS